MKLLLLIMGMVLPFLTLAQPSNDDPCNAITLTAATSCTMVQYTNAGATASANVPAPGCASYVTGDVWFKFTVPASGGVTIDTQTGNITDGGMAIYSGTCTALTLIECDDDDSDNGLMPRIIRTGLTPGATIWIRMWEYGGDLFGTFSICVQAYNPPPPAVNNECADAITITQSATCVNTLGTTNGATASAQASGGCGGTPNDDVWYRFVATAAGATVTLSNVTGTSTDMYFAVYGGTCGSLSAPLICSDPNTATFSGLTIGQTYFVRVYTWGSAVNNTNFSLCVTQFIPPPVPANDECVNAITLTPGAGCNNIAGTTGGATASAQVTGCGSGTASDDVWYKFTASSLGAVVTLSSVVGTSTDMYFAAYSGTCSSLGTPLVCSDPNSNTLASLTLGNTYYIRVYTYGTAQNNTNFNLCVQEATACGTPATQDYCMAPAILTEDPTATFSANTSGSYTSDIPANLNGVFCGSIENNSWYLFTATSTTHVFPFTSVTNCGSSTAGIQAQVYNVTTDVNSCCTNFASVSNCWNPGSTTVGTVTATNLVVGNSYYLMVDGNAGAICDFTVTGWSAVGIIPLNEMLTNVEGSDLERSNKLSWKTKYESNIDYFQIERQLIGEDKSEVVGIVPSKNLNYDVANFAYDFEDYDLRFGDMLYTIRVVTKSGEQNTDNKILIGRDANKYGILSVFPNPTSSMVTIQINSAMSGGVLELVDMQGKSLGKEAVIENGLSSIEWEVSAFAKGVYMLRFNDVDGKVFVKQVMIK